MTMRYVIVLGRTEQILIFLEGLLKIRYVRKTDFKKKIDESKWKFNEAYDIMNTLKQRACIYICACIQCNIYAIYIHINTHTHICINNF